MFRGRKLIASAVVAAFLATGIPLFAQQQQPVTSPIPANPISIQAPPGVAPGAELCFTITCYVGTPACTIEVNEIDIPKRMVKTDDPSVWLVCCTVPGGASGSDLVITAVDSNGGVATGSVTVH